MNHPLTARSVLTYTRALAGAALLVSVVVAGCGSDGVTDDGGNQLDASGGGELDASRGGELDASRGSDGPAGNLDGGPAGNLDAKNPPTDAKTLPDAEGGQVTYVSLGTAGNFVVLSGETITNTGFTIINGNVGLSPGSSITGFPPGVVNGVVHLSDAVAAKGKQDLTAAYTDASGRSGAPVPLSGDLGGKTLKPGLYVSATSMGLTSGDLTLDAGGNQDAIWVFQMGTTFISMVGRKVLLVGNAKPDNVFWSVGSSATIGVNSTMVGNFLTHTSITVQTGATMLGRFLTQVGSVTFDSNTVNRPAPIVH